jgi:predicted component of type VI protein secretion system
MIALKTRHSWPGLQEIFVDHYPFVIGRGSTNDCVLNFAFVSRQHCQFVLRDGKVFLQDLESYNGTFVNGRRITQPVAVHSGDEIGVGPLCFRVTGLNAEVGTTPLCKQPTVWMLATLKDSPPSPAPKARTRETRR